LWVRIFEERTHQMLTSKAKRVAINHVTFKEALPQQANKPGLAKRAQRVVVERVEEPPNPQQSKKALNAKPMRVVIPVEEQAVSIEGDIISEFSEDQEVLQESTILENEPNVRLFEFDAPRWKDFSGVKYQAKQVLENVVLSEQIPSDLPTSDASQDTSPYVGTCDMWFTRSHREHEPRIPDSPPGPLITPIKSVWSVAPALPTGEALQTHDSLPNASKTDRTPFLRRLKGNRTSFSITSIGSQWEGSSPLPPDSMALHLDELDGISAKNPIEDELRSRMGLKSKAIRVVLNHDPPSPIFCKEPAKDAPPRPKASPSEHGKRRLAGPTLGVSDLKKLLSQHNASLRKR
jgi:hypothetical protein